MTPLRLILVMLPLLTACSTQLQNADLSSCAAGSDTPYFSVGAFYQPDPDANTHFGHGREHDSETREAYAGILHDFDELPLKCSGADETYRFLWLRSFHPTVVIRIERTRDTYALDVASIEIIDRTRPESNDSYRFIRSHRALSRAEWSRAVSTFGEQNFWNQPAYDEPPYSTYDPVSGMVTINSSKDGARWVIEGRNDRYYVMDRASEDAPATAIGRMLIELADLKIPDEDIY